MVLIEPTGTVIGNEGMEMSRDILELILVKTQKENYIGNSKTSYDSYRWCNNILINKKEPKQSFKEGWIVVPDNFEIGRMVHQPDINHRYEILDENLVSDKLKKVFFRDEIAEEVDYDWEFKDEYSQYKSLYKSVSDKQPDLYEKIEYNIVEEIYFDEIKEVSGFKYPVKKGQWESDGFIDLTTKDVSYELLTEICIPDIARQNFPCSLTSEQSYKIIRKHIQDNINPIYAKITSDYNFCFTVKKKIEKCEPEKYTYNANLGHNLFSKRKKKPLYRTAYRKEREIEVFEMTHEAIGYKNYTVIKGFKGNSLVDLKNEIDVYLSELMKMINEPLIDCSSCKGMGVKLKKISPTQGR